MEKEEQRWNWLPDDWGGRGGGCRCFNRTALEWRSNIMGCLSLVQDNDHVLRVGTNGVGWGGDAIVVPAEWILCVCKAS